MLKKLGSRNYTLIAEGVKALGTYDPDMILTFFEESLYAQDVAQIIDFLTWVHTNKKEFGSGNYEEVFHEFLVQAANVKETPATSNQPAEKTKEEPSIFQSKISLAAKDAKVNHVYLAETFHKIKILKLQGIPEEGYVSSVLAESETSNKPVNISAETRLIPYDKKIHKPYVDQYSQTKEGDDTMATPTKNSNTAKGNGGAKKASNEPKDKMSDIINPMLTEGKYTAEQVADAVIKKFPAKKNERTKLISRIRGPRLTRLQEKARAARTKVPSLVESKEATKPEAPAKKVAVKKTAPVTKTTAPAASAQPAA